MKIRHYLIPVVLSVFTLACQPKEKKPLKVSELFSDHIVLQQEQDVDFWGEYTPGEEVILSGSWGDKASVEVDTSGHWIAKLPTPEAGGPYKVEIITEDSTITLEDVLVGEVWLASGQSNMEMPLKGWPPEAPIQNSGEEIAQAAYPEIRMFTVVKNLSASPLDSVTGAWSVSSPETAGDFSATAYFFARKLHEDLGVPVGIIHSSWGGTVAEAWTSKASLNKMGDFDEAIKGLENPETQKVTNEWFSQWPTKAIPDTEEEWQNIDFSDLAAAEPDFDDSQWADIELPGRFDQLNSSDYDGAMWFRKEFTVADPASDYTLHIGAVDDMDATYVNGQKIGGLAGSGYYNTPREITVPKSLLVQGRNVIAIRAIDTGGPGVFVGPIKLINRKGDEISLEGTWKSQLIAEIYQGQFYVYHLDTDMSTRPNIVLLNPNLPTVLYNAMIHPLAPYTIKGAIWYQGESNVGRAEQYKQLFPTMIGDWREKWGYDFPFYFVQIAPYIYNPDATKQASQELRDAQRLSLKTPNTGMAVTLDIGNATNIHPADKQDVGDRLARLALAKAYGKDVVPCGPLFKGVEKSGNKLIIEFDEVDGGLKASDEGLSGFEIAGADKNYVPATAEIVNDRVEVSSPSVKSPEYVRYAWSDDAEASLFNKEGLPASSFTSEE